MSTHKAIDRICCAGIVLAVLLALVFMNGESLGIQAASSVLGYEDRLFDTGTVHTIDIVMDDWEGFLEGCTDEEYVLCDLVIDGETCANVAIRAKGNTSLTQVASYGNDRYSFKIEFDHYDSGNTYHGLDKLCLNNIIQDNTYMKDYLTYQMMAAFGVNAPLCSFVYLTVNGEDWGLYLAVEGVEDAFLQRNYGSNSGELYKPDTMDMGGGRSNGGAFDMEEWMAGREADGAEDAFDRDAFLPERGEGAEAGDMPEPPQGGAFGAAPEGESPFVGAPGEAAEGSGDGGSAFGGRGGGMGGSLGSDDVSLLYTDDDYDSYSNIFENAKTDITDADKDRLIQSLRLLNEGEDIESVVDVEQVIRYFVVHNFVCNFDSYTGSMIHNYYLYEEDGQLSMIPWDYNLAFGGFQGSEDATALVNYPIDTPVSGGSVDSRPMLAWIFASEEYTELYHQYFDEFISGYFGSGYFSQLMDQVYDLIAPYVERDPTKFCTYEEFEAGFAALEQFCLLRAESVQGQLEGTIPATSDGQSQDSSALIDASGLTISDMGSMNGGGMGLPGGRGDFPGTAEDGSPAAPSSGGFPEDGVARDALPEGEEAPETLPDDAAEAPGAGAPADSGSEAIRPGQDGGFSRQEDGFSGQGGFTVPDGSFSAPDGGLSGQSTESALLLGVSAAVLLAAIAAALLYKKRV